MIDLFFTNPDLFRVINFYTDLRNLCDTCTVLSTMKQYIFYLFNREYSLLYYDDILFRQRVLNKICNPCKQLHLNLSDCNQIIDVSVLGNVRTLNLRNCSDIKKVVEKSIAKVKEQNYNNYFLHAFRSETLLKRRKTRRRIPKVYKS
jgi:hypothetical protein